MGSGRVSGDIMQKPAFTVRTEMPTTVLANNEMERVTASLQYILICTVALLNKQCGLVGTGCVLNACLQDKLCCIMFVQCRAVLGSQFSHT